MHYNQRALFSLIADAVLIFIVLVSGTQIHRDPLWVQCMVYFAQLVATGGAKAYFLKNLTIQDSKRNYYMMTLLTMYIQTFFIALYVKTYGDIPPGMATMLETIPIPFTILSITISWIWVLIPEINEMYRCNEEEEKV